MNSIDIADRAREIASLPDFDVPDWWLTFYLAGQPAQLDAFGEALAGDAFRAVNLDGSEGGFLYPKVPVSADPTNVAAIAVTVAEQANSFDVSVLSVDVDTSPDVTNSKFKLLYLSNDS